MAVRVITVFETASGKPVTLPAIPNGGVGGVSIARSESKLAFYVSGDRSPNDLHVLQLGANGAPVKLTSSLSRDIDAADLVDTQVVRARADATGRPRRGVRSRISTGGGLRTRRLGVRSRFSSSA